MRIFSWRLVLLVAGFLAGYWGYHFLRELYFGFGGYG